MEHLDNDKKALDRIRNLCIKGGIIIASSPSRSAPLFRLHLLDIFDKKVGHLRRYSRSEFLSLFKSNDFEVIRIINTEGVLRNFLFTNPVAGKLIRFIRGPISDFVTFLDELTIPLFGESHYYIVAKKK